VHEVKWRDVLGYIKGTFFFGLHKACFHFPVLTQNPSSIWLLPME
jgi:hypothetical protein